MYTCPHCGSTVVELTRQHTLYETLTVTTLTSDGDYEEEDAGSFGDTLTVSDWEAARCAGCGQTLDLATLFPDQQAPTETETAMTTTAIHATAQWIIETALEAEQCHTRGDEAGVAVCLEAIATYAKNVYDATTS